MKLITELLTTNPNLNLCHIVVGVSQYLQTFAEKRIGVGFEEVEAVVDHMVVPGKGYLVFSELGVQISDNLKRKVAVWDVAGGLTPNSPILLDLINRAAKERGVKVDAKTLQYRLMEGRGELTNINIVWLEALQIVTQPPVQKPELPWVTPGGFHKLKHTQKMLDAVYAFKARDESKLKTLHVQERQLEGWDNLPDLLLRQTQEVLTQWRKGEHSDNVAHLLLREIWEGNQVAPKRKEFHHPRNLGSKER